MNLNKKQKKILEKLNKKRAEKMKNAGNQGAGFGKIDEAIELTKKQPEAIKNTLEKSEKNSEIFTEIFKKEKIENIISVGCGDSYFSGLAVRMGMEKITDKIFLPFQALEYSRYYNNFTSDRSIIFPISSSGVVPRTVEAMFVGKNKGAISAAVTNNEDSPLAKYSDYILNVEAERKGPPTQSSLGAMTSMLFSGIKLAEINGRKEIAKKALNDIYSLPKKIQSTIEKSADIAKNIAQDLAKEKTFHFIGGGPSWAVAHFGYAKVREATWDEAIPWELEEWDHEQTGQIPEGLPVFLIAPNGNSYDRAKEIANVVNKDNGYLITIVNEGEKEISSLADVVIEIPETPEYLSPFTFTVPIQLFSLYLAKTRI